MRGQRVADGEGHRSHVTGRVWPLRDHPTARIEDRHREVLPLARLLGVRGLVHGGADLHGDRLKRPPDHPERDGVRRAHAAATLTSRLAYSSTAAVAPGGSTDVDSRSSTMTGPVSCPPGASA